MPHIRAQSHAQSLQVGWRGRVSLGVTSTRSLSLSLSLRAQFPQPLRSRVLGKLEGRKASLLSALFVLVFFVSHFCKAHKREPKPEMLRRVLIVAAALASTEVTGSTVQQHRIVTYMSS